ncbi:hypothetical protein CAPTEDRAFT_197149 [Capitella teleta]|uniref:SANTA domain-containing protein n=1 Tax=Capitella teleta TaxID=283909 RepID=R7U8B7_CAPTE|nr:hypothetical protein CAPTEDRAFT_197149 [Capitella teleta]|eukprot:ELT99330.1 hypothetical protein CAPTEDRAFT_197149 [Capitella teleta]
MAVRSTSRRSDLLQSPPAELFQQIKAEKLRRLSMQPKLKPASSPAIRQPPERNLMHSFKVLQESTNNKRHDEAGWNTEKRVESQVLSYKEDENRMSDDKEDENRMSDDAQKREKEEEARDLSVAADSLIASIDVALKRDSCSSLRRSCRLQMQDSRKNSAKTSPPLSSKMKASKSSPKRTSVSIRTAEPAVVCIEQTVNPAETADSQADEALFSGDEEPTKRDAVLEEWSIRLVKKGVVVDGHLRGHAHDDLWHSSVVSKCLSPKVIVTSQGSKYTLCGSMDRKAARLNGVPEALIRAFKSGFPKNWQEMLELHSLPKKPSKMRKVKTEEKNGVSHKQTPSKLNSSLSTMPLDMESLPTSRSGRKLIPQLPWWTSQRVVLYKPTDDVMVLPGSVDTFSHKENKMIERKSTIKSLKRRIAGRKSASSRAAKSHREDAVNKAAQKSASAADSPCAQLFLPDALASRDPVPGHMDKISLSADIHQVLKNHRKQRQPRTKRKTCYSGKLQTTPLSRQATVPLDVLQSANRRRSSISRMKSPGVLPCVHECEADCLTQSFEAKTARVSHREEKTKRTKHHKTLVPLFNCSLLLAELSSRNSEKISLQNIAPVKASEKDGHRAKRKSEKITKRQKHQAMERAGKGTVKRKRQIRDLIEHHEKDHNDNPFEATPFKKSKAFNLPAHLLNSSESLGEHMSGVDTMLKTPRPDWMTDPIGLTTPCSALTTPGMLNSVDRNAADRYVNRLKKGRDVKGSQVRPTQTPTSVRSLQPSI